MSDRCTSHLQLTIKSLMPTVHWRQSFYFMRMGRSAVLWELELERKRVRRSRRKWILICPVSLFDSSCFSPFFLLSCSCYSPAHFFLSHNLLDDLKRHFAIFSNLLSNSFDFHYNIARTAVLSLPLLLPLHEHWAYIVGSFTMHWLITITLDV